MTRAPRPRGALSWGLYDLANTVYSISVLTLFFAPWVTVDRGREDLWFSLPFGLSMGLVALSLPFLGLWSDRSRSRLPFLAVFTGVCVLATASLGWFTRIPGTAGLVAALLAFAVSNYAFQGGLVFYNALLPSVSTPETRGRVSGLGVGLGYVGAFVGLIVVTPIVDGRLPGIDWTVPFLTPGGREAAFVPTAILFAVLALPLFLRVREPARPRRPRPTWGEAWRDLRTTLADARRYPGLRWFLLANFLILDAIHTAIVFISVYTEKVLGMQDLAKSNLFLIATAPAILGSLGAGWASDRWGPRPVFLATAWLWVVCPIVIALATSTTVIYVTAAVIGVVLGSLWTVSRPFLLSMTPAGEEGRLFGLYAFCNKSAAVVGPQIWGLTVLLGASLGPNRYRLAVILLALVAAGGAVLLHRTPRVGAPTSA